MAKVRGEGVCGGRGWRDGRRGKVAKTWGNRGEAVGEGGEEGDELGEKKERGSGGEEVKRGLRERGDHVEKEEGNCRGEGGGESGEGGVAVEGTPLN